MNPRTHQHSASQDAPLAIIGLGCLFPGAQDLHGYWASIRSGRDHIEEVPDGYWDLDDYHDSDRSSLDRTYGRRGGFLTPVPFRPLDFGIAPNDLEATDTSQLLSLIAAKQALTDAGYDSHTAFDRSRTSVILGVTGALELVIPLGARLGHPHWWRALREAGVDEKTASDVVRRISDSYVPWKENSFPGLLGNVVAGRIANRLDLHGTNCVTDAACASSLAALHLASLELRSGRSDMVITGGVDTFNDIFMYMCFSKTPALSPTGDARPFDGAGDGTILGEGIGVLVLKRLDDAVRDGDRIYARLLSIGTSSDGKGAAIYAPTAAGQQRALLDAYEQAAISPSTIGMVEAHGTGTSVGDATELQALQEVYSRGKALPNSCALGSVKSQIGHTKAAAGAAGLIKAVLSLHHKVQPPSIKIREPLDALREANSPFHIEEQARPWVSHPGFPRRAAVSSFGFGGSNFHAVLEENSAGRVETDWSECCHLLTFSDQTTDRLAQQLKDALAELKSTESAHILNSMARDSRAGFRNSDEHRISIVVEYQGDPKVKLETALDTLSKETDSRWNLPNGIDRDSGPCRGSLAVIFPGQGSQKVNMLRPIACRFPEMIQTVDDAERVFWNQQEDSGLASRIWPPRSWTDDAEKNDAELRRTEVAQPSLGAVSLGLFRVLSRFGIGADLFGGHSFGELTALAASGRLTETDFHQLANFRGRLMASAGGEEAGSMLAVALPIRELERFVEENCPHLVIANRNAPQQAVLSGQDAAISDAIRILEQRGIRHRKLPVAAAFHSEEVASAAAPFEEVLQRARFHPATAAVFANSTAREYPEAESDAKSILAHQIARPVQFLEMIEEMVQRGATTFLEVGPGQVLTGLIRSILEDCSEGATAISVDSGKPDLTDLASAVGRLAVEGHPVDLCSWDPHGRPIEKEDGAMVVMIRGANLGPGEASARPETDVVRPPTTDTSSPPSVTPAASITTSSVAERVTPAARPDDRSAPAMTVTESQENLMQAIESALSMQQKLAGAQRTAEQVLEASLNRSPGTSRPSAPIPAPVPVPVPATETDRPIHDAVEEVATTADDGLMAAILEIVADKTGYPTSAIGTDLDLESDLGIDSIKRVEILSALRVERPDLEAIPAELLGTLRSIDAIVEWYHARTPEPKDAMRSSEVDTGAADPVVARPTEIVDTTLPSLIREVVADKTGYPVDAIGTDLDLEADLGIDSIKRVEILSALRQTRPELPAIPPELLGTLRTIDSIVSWYSEVSPNSGIDTEIVPEPPRQQPTATEEDGVESIIVSVISEKTGYPAEAIGTDLDLEADLGIDSIKRVEILSAIRERKPQLPAIPPELLGTLRSIDSIVGWYLENSSTVATPEAQQETVAVAASVAAGPSHNSADFAIEAADRTYLDAIPVARPVARRRASQMTTAFQQRPFHVVCDQPQLARTLVALLRSRGISALSSPLCGPGDPEPMIGSETPGGLLLLLDSPADPDEAIRNAFRWLRATGRCFQDADDSHGALVALVQRFDGRFGLEPLDGTLVDADPAAAALSGLAKCAAREWPAVQVRSIDLSLAFDDPGEAAQQLVDELSEGEGMEIGLAPEGRIEVQLQSSAEDEPQGELLRDGGLVIVTGGARGVTAACVEEVARRYQPNFLLLGRTAAPGDEPDWALGVADDQLESRYFELQGQKVSPAAIRARATEILRMREMSRLFDRLRQSGCSIDYRSVDVRDRFALERCIDEARTRYGPVRGIIHGAGVLADRWITEKSDEQFDLVWSTKVDPARHLLSICREEELDFICFFSSMTARLGRKGQSDYAAANEVLNRMAITEATRRASCRVRSIGWGPWDGGMVHPGLRSVFHDEGIDLIGLREGARVFIEKMQSNGPAQCVILAPMGSVEETLLAIGSFPTEATQRTTAPVADVVAPKMETGQTLTISTDQMPVLLDHFLDARAVVPAALLLEWCLWAASHRHPGLELHGADDFRIFKGVVLDANEERQVTFQTGPPATDGALLRVPVEIRSGDDSGRVHARAHVLLGDRISTRSHLQVPYYPEDNDPVYPALLFHGPRFHCIQQVARISSLDLAIRSVGAPPPREWLASPMRSDWLIDPLRIDAVFQALILWSRSQRGMPSLPCAIARVRCHLPIDSGVLETRIAIESSKGATASARVEILNRSGLPAITIEGAEMVIDAALENAFGCDQQTEEVTP